MNVKTIALLVAASASAATYADDSWINLNDQELRANLQTSIDALKAQSRQIYMNRDENYQQDIDIQHNLDLINSLDNQVNTRITQVANDFNSDLTDLGSEVDNQFSQVDSDLAELDRELDFQFDEIDFKFRDTDNRFNLIDGKIADIDSLANDANSELDYQYSLISALNNETKTINGRDVISGRTVSGTSLSSQISSLNSRMDSGENTLASHSSSISTAQSRADSAYSLAQSAYNKAGSAAAATYTQTCVAKWSSGGNDPVYYTNYYQKPNQSTSGSYSGGRYYCNGLGGFTLIRETSTY